MNEVTFKHFKSSKNFPLAQRTATKNRKKACILLFLTLFLQKINYEMATLKIYSDIVDAEDKAMLEWEGLQGFTFDDVDGFIASIPANDNAIKLLINCRGGSTREALAIYDALRATGKEISAEVVGECSSSATILLLAAKKEERWARPNASFLIHNPYVMGCVRGDGKDMQTLADELNRVRDQFLDIYVERTGTDRETLAAIMDDDKEMSAKRAMALGFISGIIQPLSAKSQNPANIKNMKFVDRLFKALGATVGVYALELSTADGTTLEINKESGEPAVGDEVVSGDGDYLMPDGTTIVVEGGFITEIKPAEVEEPEEPAEEPEEPKAEGDDEPAEGEDPKDAEIEELKKQLEERDAKIAELEEKLKEAQTNAKTNDERNILNMVAVAGGVEWLKTVKSKGNVEQRDFEGSAQKTVKKKLSFAEYMAQQQK